jgi:stress response protein YsnF
MKQTVVGIFDYGIDAQMAAQELMKQGIPNNSIDIAVRGANERQPNNTNNLNTTATNPNDKFDRPNPTHSDTTNKDESFFGSLFDDKDESRKYAEVSKHGAIVTVHANSREQAEMAAELLDHKGAIDVNDRAEKFKGMPENKRSGWINSKGGSDVSINVVEENLQVGKREVETGGVHMRSRIIEKPVEEHLRLREEHVSVERNAVNRPANKQDMASFKDGEINMVEHAEIPVVNKEARVVEEIKLNKKTDIHDETIRDTVRKQDVDIDKLDPNKDSRNLTDRDRDRKNI